MPINYGGSGVSNGLGGLTSNRIALQAGSAWTPPANWYNVALGRYTDVQKYDPISTLWLPLVDVPGNHFIRADGVNIRLANTTGCVIGALITNAGTGYTSAPAVAASAGGSNWISIIGGAVNTTVTVSYGGSNYTYAPQVVFSAPPSPGVQATGYATISAGVVTSVTVLNQGAGYTTPPTINFINVPGDNGSGAQAVATLTGAGTVTAVLCSTGSQNGFSYGSPQTAVPTLSFSGGGGSGAAATAIMNFCLTGYTVTTAGAGYTAAAGSLTLSATPLPTAGTPIYTNPSSQTGLLKLRPAIIAAPASASGVITATGLLVIDGGAYEAVPAAGSVVISGGTGIITTAAVLALTVGGLNDDGNYIYPG